MSVSIATGVPILGVTGVNGAGKTLLAVQFAIEEMRRGVVVYSTVQITSKWGDSIPIRSLGQLLTVRDALIVLDEISTVFSSRTSSSMPPEFVTWLHTLRHRGNRVIWTAPGWMRADNQLREVTQGVVNVVPLLRQRSKEDPWPRPRVVFAGLMDTGTGKADSVPTKVLRRRLYIPTKLDAFGAYDTLADVPQIGMGQYSPWCECGGSQPRPKHTKERHEMLNLPWVDDVQSFDAFAPVAPAIAGPSFEPAFEAAE